MNNYASFHASIGHRLITEDRKSLLENILKRVEHYFEHVPSRTVKRDLTHDVIENLLTLIGFSVNFIETMSEIPNAIKINVTMSNMVCLASYVTALNMRLYQITPCYPKYHSNLLYIVDSPAKFLRKVII